MSTPSWQTSRPWRNKNPGDLRILSGTQTWFHQSGVDRSAGGPFAIFPAETDGWGALATCLMAYQDLHGLNTIQGIIGRFAPALENDTGGYISLVCSKMNVTATQKINTHDFDTLEALCISISLAEGGHLIPWTVANRTSGIAAAISRGAGTVPPPKPMSLKSYATAAPVPKPIAPAKNAPTAQTPSPSSPHNPLATPAKVAPSDLNQQQETTAQLNNAELKALDS